MSWTITSLPLCRNCAAPGADPDHRFLCNGCYSAGPIRSCFSFDGRRIAPAPTLPLREAEVAESPPPLPEPPEAARMTQRPRARGPAGDAEDDAALLAAVDALTAEAGYRTPDGQAVAGSQAAIRAARLSQHRGATAVERLVLAGVLRRVSAHVVKNTGCTAGGRNAAALQRIAKR